MKKLILASVSALALFGVAACSDTTDNTTTQSVPQTEAGSGNPLRLNRQRLPAPPSRPEPAPAQ